MQRRVLKYFFSFFSVSFLTCRGLFLFASYRHVCWNTAVFLCNHRPSQASRNWAVIWPQGHPPAARIPSQPVPSLYDKQTVLPPLNYFGMIVEIIVNSYICLFLDSHIDSRIYMSILMSIPHKKIFLLSFIGNFKIRKYESSNIVLFFLRFYLFICREREGERKGKKH